MLSNVNLFPQCAFQKLQLTSSRALWLDGWTGRHFTPLLLTACQRVPGAWQEMTDILSTQPWAGSRADWWPVERLWGGWDGGRLAGKTDQCPVTASPQRPEESRCVNVESACRPQTHTHTHVHTLTSVKNSLNYLCLQLTDLQKWHFPILWC